MSRSSRSASPPCKSCDFVARIVAMVVVLVLGAVIPSVELLGDMCSISASYGEDDPIFCAIEATSEQQVFCWGKNVSVESPSTGPSMVGLSGGVGFMCGIQAASARPFCWQRNLTSINIVPEEFANASYVSIAAGDGHVCAVRSQDSLVECWNGDAALDPPRGVPLRSLVAGRRFVCGIEISAQSAASGTARCWGEADVVPPEDVMFESLSAGGAHVCGIVATSREIRCWGDNRLGQTEAPRGIPFVTLGMGLDHGCAVRQDTHTAMCWGHGFNASSIPERTEFLALSSSRAVTCGVREDNLLVVCWGNGTDFAPPLQLASPGVCTTVPCSMHEFRFNASSLGVVSAGLCSSSEEQVCAPCASDCSSGSFLSSPCSGSENRRCMDCALCETGACRAVCRLPMELAPKSSPAERRHHAVSLAAVLGAAISGGVAVALLGFAILCCLQRRKRRSWLVWRTSGSGRSDCHLNGGGGSGTVGGMTLAPTLSGGIPSGAKVPEALRYRLSELRDATGNFKEVNELGRGSYGCVYKAVLGDGRLVAVKRANAARRIHGSSRDFDAELEILSKLRHAHIVNLLGYCGEMGERLLVYEFMPHGTLRDHLHGGLSALCWALRLRIAAQAAKGLEFLHREDVVHRDVKSANILLDGDWAARVADFGLAQGATLADAGYLDPEYNTAQRLTAASDVYGFGVVLLEIVTGRKAEDGEFEPARVVEWAAPLIRSGRAASVVDRTVETPRNVEPVVRLAEVAEMCVRGRCDERPSMAQVAGWCEQIAQGNGNL